MLGRPRRKGHLLPTTSLVTEYSVWTVTEHYLTMEEANLYGRSKPFQYVTQKQDCKVQLEKFHGQTRMSFYSLEWLSVLSSQFRNVSAMFTGSPDKPSATRSWDC